MKKLTEIVLPEVCSLCNLPAITGMIDMAKGGTFASFCLLHLKKFCEKTLKKLQALEQEPKIKKHKHIYKEIKEERPGCESSYCSEVCDFHIVTYYQCKKCPYRARECWSCSHPPEKCICPNGYLDGEPNRFDN